MQRVMTPRVNRRPITYTRQRHKTNRVPVWVCRVAAGISPLGRHRIPWHPMDPLGNVSSQCCALDTPQPKDHLAGGNSRFNASHAALIDHRPMLWVTMPPPDTSPCRSPSVSLSRTLRERSTAATRQLASAHGGADQDSRTPSCACFACPSQLPDAHATTR